LNVIYLQLYITVDIFYEFIFYDKKDSSNGSAMYTERKERENQSGLWRLRLSEENKGEDKE
jgi:hypothetical protein